MSKPGSEGETLTTHMRSVQFKQHSSTSCIMNFLAYATVIPCAADKSNLTYDLVCYVITQSDDNT